MSSLHGASEVRPLGAPGRNRWVLFVAVLTVIAIAMVGSVVLMRVLLRPGPSGQGQAIVPVATTTPSATPSPTSTPVPTPTEDPQAAAVLQAYLDQNAAYVHALVPNPNPSDPGLAATQTGPVRLQTGTFIAIAQTLRLTFRGDTVVHNLRLVSLQGTTAGVTYCEVDTTHAFNVQGQPVNARTGQPMPAGYDPTRPEYNSGRATLVLTDGAWKVRDNTADVVSACP